jgi:hypothetical protein
MDNVTLHAQVQSTSIDGGIKFAANGDGEVKQSIQRMVMSHAGIMNGVGGWKLAAAKTDSGAVMSVVVPAKDLNKLRALGFIGVMTRGMHHQEHHLMIARGEHPRG